MGAKLMFGGKQVGKIYYGGQLVYQDLLPVFKGIRLIFLQKNRERRSD